MRYDRPELLDKLAAEYVLGTMSARVRRRFQAIQHTSLAAQRAVQDWERRLSPLAQSVPPAQPRASTWEAIERRTGAAATPAASAGWSWGNWFKPALGVAFGVVATLGLVKLYPEDLVPVDDIVQARSRLPESYVGLLTDAANHPVVLASSTRHGKVMSIKILRNIEVPAGKVLQLWALPKEGTAFPLGVVPATGKGVFQMADTSEKLLSAVPRLAISIEDAPAQAGSKPAEFVLTGNCVKLW
jgi:anti-sigma-K factor RskA